MSGWGGGVAGVDCRHHQESDRKTPSFICKLQKTIEVRGGAGDEHYKYRDCLESGYGQNAWFDRG